jgi:hypothetical protein
MPKVKGSDLPPAMQRRALAAYVHRFTGDHAPQWARKPMPDGKPYPLQFASDAEWLENTLFSVTAAGDFSKRDRYCRSAPTWPNNPELRDGARWAQWGET